MLSIWLKSDPYLRYGIKASMWYCIKERSDFSQIGMLLNEQQLKIYNIHIYPYK